MEFTSSRRILYVVFALIAGFVNLKLTARFCGGGEYFARIVPLFPVPFLLIALAFRESYGKLTDFYAPLVPVVHAGAHIGCIFTGCCHGYPSKWGLYSNVAETVCFPNVPLEIITLYVLSGLMTAMICKGKQQGRLYAWYMVLFGVTRFFLEFLRDNEKIWCGLSELSFQALASVVLGLVMLAISKWICKRSPQYEESKI